MLRLQLTTATKDLCLRKVCWVIKEQSAWTGEGMRFPLIPTVYEYNNKHRKRPSVTSQSSCTPPPPPRRHIKWDADGGSLSLAEREADERRKLIWVSCSPWEAGVFTFTGHCCVPRDSSASTLASTRKSTKANTCLISPQRKTATKSNW